MSSVKRKLIIIGAVTLGLGSFYGGVNLTPKSKLDDFNKFISLDGTKICAHRGGAFLNPENTIMAFDYAIKETSYIDYLEIDVRRTKDDKLVINHDANINRMALPSEEASYTIKDHTFEELEKFNLGRNFVTRNNETPYLNLTYEEAKQNNLTMITLDTFLTRYSNIRDFGLFIEIKDDGEEGIVVAKMIEDIINKEENKYWQDKTTIISFNNSALDYVEKNSKYMEVSPLGGEAYSQMITSYMGLSTLVQTNYKLVQVIGRASYGIFTVSFATQRIVDEAHSRNQALAFWTINNEADMKRCVGYGVDIITTDAPDVLHRIIEEAK